MNDDSYNVLLQLSEDELVEVLEEFTGIELSEEQAAGIRQLIEIAGSLEGAIERLQEISNSGAELEALENTTTSAEAA